MAKFNMADYQNFLEEEERQAQIQEDLADRLAEETADADSYWRKWQFKQGLVDSYGNPRIIKDLSCSM